MHVAKDEVDGRMQIPGAVIRQRTDLGSVKGFDKISGEYFSLADGVKETVNTNDLFYWPPGHTVKVEEDAEIIMFSPQREHSLVINHMLDKVRG